MKKKILSLRVIAILIIMLITLTGCGDKTEEENINDENKKDSISQVENKGGIVVTDVYATSDKYAVVEADNKTYIIDNNGNKQGTIDFEINKESTITINNDGYIYYSASYETNKILDKTGKIIFEKNNNENYNYVTENNYTLRTSTKSDFENGSSRVTEIIDMSGKVIKETEDKTSYYYLGGDIWYGYSSEDSSYFLYNEKTENKVAIEGSTYQSLGNSIEYTEGNERKKGVGYSLKDGGTFIGGQYVTADLKVMGTAITYVNNKYYYNKDDYSIYQYGGIKEKEFTSGNGFSYIFSVDDKYYAKSGTGYFYTLDKELNQIDEPYKLDEIKGSTRKVGNNCILNKESVKFSEKGYEGTWDHFYLYDYKGNLIEDLGEGWNGITEIGNHIIQLDRMKSTEYNERTGNRDTTYIGSQSSNKYINLSTGKLLKVY